MKIKNKNKITSTAFAISMISVDTINCINAINSYAQSMNEYVALEQNTKLIDVLGKPVYDNNKVSFPEANYTDNICGYNIKTGVPTSYIENNKTKISKDGNISSKSTLTKSEFSALLKSLELDISNGDSNIKIEVGKNIDGFTYLQENGHYYKFIEEDITSIEDAKKLAKTHSVYDNIGYIPIVDTEKEKELLEKLSNGKKSVALDTDLNIITLNPDEINSKEIGNLQGYFVEIEIENLILDTIVDEKIISPKINLTESIVELPSTNNFLDNTEYTENKAEDNTEDIEINSIDISNGLENAVVTSSRNFILGFKIEAVSSTPVKFIYNLNGEEVINNSKILNFYDMYTVEEAQNIIRSLKVESNSNVKLKITLGNMKDGLSYLESTGHYYEVKEVSNGITWSNAKVEAEKNNYLNSNGYLATISSDDENNLIGSHTISEGLNGVKVIFLGASDAEIEGQWKWITGEPFAYTKWGPNSPNGARNQNYLYMFENAHANRGLWDDTGATDKGVAYAVEYGDVGQKLPAPTKNTSSEITIESNSSFDLGATNLKDNVISFPKANSNFLGTGKLNIIYGIGYTEDIVTNYTLNGVRTSLSSKVIKTDALTNDEMNEVLSSLTITGKEANKPLNFTITIDFGQQIYLYNPSNGHYYGIFSALPSYQENKVMAESQEYLGEKGYIVTPMSEEEDSFLHGIVDNDFWLGIKYDNSVGNLIYDGGYKKGEVVTYEKGWNRRPDSSTPHAHANDKNAHGLWTYCGNKEGRCPTPIYTIVEFGGEGRMPTPAELGETMGETIYIGSTLSLGDYVEEDGKITFPNYSASVNESVNLVITYNDEDTENVITEYTLDGQKYSLNESTITTPKLTEEQLIEVLDSLVISGYDKSKGLNLTVKIVSDYDIDDYLTSTNVVIEGVEDNLIDISNGLENAVVRFSEDKITKFNIKVNGSSATNRVEYQYTLNGSNIKNKNQEVNFNGSYTAQDVQDILRSMKVISGEDVELIVTLTDLGISSQTRINKVQMPEDNEPTETNSIDISNGFENALVTSSRDFILGFKVEVIQENATNRVEYEYVLNGNTVKNKNQTLNFYGEYAPSEIQEILRSMKVISGDDVKIKVTLGNLNPNMIYIEEEGHYYELVNSNVSWAVAKTNASKKSLLGNTGYLASTNTPEIIDKISKFTNKKVSVGLSKNSNNLYSWVSGEPVTYLNVNDTAYSCFALTSGGKYASMPSDHYNHEYPYLVEYGTFGERMPRPTVQTSSEVEVGKVQMPEDNEPIEINSIDISNGLENAIVTSSRDFILGFKVEVNQPTPDNKVSYTYTLNEKEVVNENQTLNFYDVYTPKEVEAIVKSIKVTSPLDVKIKVTLGNLNPNMIYIEEEGHYYELVNSNVSWAVAKTNASKKSLLGNTGYLASTNTPEIIDKISKFTNKKVSVGLSKNSNNLYSWVSGEPVTYLNFNDTAYSCFALISGGKYASMPSDHYNHKYPYLVEYGTYGERMPRPTVNNYDELELSLNDYDAPEIHGATNKAFEVNTTIKLSDLYDGVTAYDIKDGDLTDKIEVEIRDITGKIDDIFTSNIRMLNAIDTSREGEYLVTYKVSDKARNQASKSVLYIIEDNNIVIKNINLNLFKNENIVNGEFNTFNSKKYKVFRKDLNDLEYKEILELENTNIDLDNTIGSLNFNDTLLEDVKNPTIENYYIIKNRDGSIKVEINAEDLANVYTYQVKGYDRKNRIVEQSNEVSKGGYASGISKYYYLLDNNSDTEITENNSIESTSNIFDIESDNENSFMHIKVVDNTGNSSETIHINLSNLDYNNAPKIRTSKNKVINAGEIFNPMNGVTAYDYEDGDITKNITYEEIDKLNVNKVGSYRIKYTVEDSEGLKDEIVVTIHVAGSMDLTVKDGSNKLEIEWEADPNASSYEVYRTSADGFDYNLLGEYTSTGIVDTTALDVKNPIIKNVYEQYLPQDEINTKSTNEETKLIIEEEDLSSTYRYFVRSLDSHGNPLNSTGVGIGKSKSGFAGFSFTIDEHKDTEAPTTMTVTSGDEVNNAIKGNISKFLHIRAFDESGNMSNTYHYLIGGKYETNFIPVINNVKKLYTVVGREINLLSGIRARDYEDGDLTGIVAVSGDVDYSKPGVYDIVYSVTDSHNNTREVKSIVRVMKYMNLAVNPSIEDNNIKLNWEQEAITDLPVYYEVRKYNPEVDRFTVIGTTDNTEFVDEKATDIFGAIYNGSRKKLNDDGSITITIDSSDRGCEHKYQVVARMKDTNHIVGTMTNIDTNEEMFKEGSLVGGIKGYSWHLSNMREDVVDNEVDVYDNNITFNPDSYEWLHFAPIDIYGNKTDTVHIRLNRSSNENNAPIINGNDITVTVGTQLDLDKLVSAYDKEDGDLTEFIKYDGDVNLDLVGTYTVSYSVSDFDGVVSRKNLNISVVDNIYNNDDIAEEEKKGFLEVFNLEEDYMYVNAEYNPMKDVKVVSSVDGDITGNVTYKTNLDTSTIGSYNIYYKVSDSSGKTVSFLRVVHVTDIKEDIKDDTSDVSGVNNYPVIYKPGYVDENGNVFEPYYERLYVCLGEQVDIRKFFKAYDKEDGDLTDKMSVSGMVNLLKPGIYSVTFKVTDSDMNTSYKTLTVEVYKRHIDNPDGTLPDSPNQGENDEGINGGGLPNKPGQEEQKPPTEESPGTDSGNTDGENTNQDIYEDLDINIDIDKDGKPDINIDINNDGKPDINIDVDKDGKPDINIDTNGDGKPDINVDTDGDGKADTNIDTNGDGKPDIDISTKPQTGDNILSLGSIFGLSLCGLILNNKKKLK